MLQSKISPDRLKVFVAFLIVYLVWGSTYIATRFSLESMPLFLMIAIRYLIAGSIMYVWMRMRGAPKPEKAHLVPTAVLGVLLLVFGSAGAAMAVRTVPTGMVSLLVAIGPVYIVLLQWLKPGGSAPDKKVFAGIVVGIAGLLLLLGPDKIATNSGIDLFGVICVLIGSLGAAVGAIYARSARVPASQPLAAGMQMLFASAVLFVISACTGEFSSLQHLNISLKSTVSLVYLIVFGSMMAFTAYGWLLKTVPVTRVSTYAYVNPVVAVFLGWFLAGEVISMQTIAGAAIILSAVALITRSKVTKQLAAVRIDCSSGEETQRTGAFNRAGCAKD